MLTISVLIMVVIMSLMVTLVKRTRESTIKSVDFAVQEHGRGLAKNGVEYVLWKLRRSPDNYKTIMTGGQVSELDGNTIRDDYTRSGRSRASTGFYTMDVNLGPGPQQFTIDARGWGKVNENLKTRIIATYEDISINSAIYVESDPLVLDMTERYGVILEGGNGPEIHWGPILSRRGIDVDNFNRPYPRKIAMWRVKGRDNGSDLYPNNDLKEYWAHSNNVPVEPRFAIAIMKQQAQDGSPDNPSGVVTYYDSAGGPPTTLGDIILNKNTTWFFDGGVRLTGQTYMKGIIIVNGDLFIDNTAIGGNDIGFGSLTVPIPEQAKKEYERHFEQTGSYAGVPGLESDPDATTYTFPYDRVGMVGFVYVNGNVIVNKNAAPFPFYIYGSLYVKGQFSAGRSNAFKIFMGDFKNNFLPRPEMDTPSFKLVSKKEKLLK